MPYKEDADRYRIGYITTKDEQQAKEIAKVLLQERLIACANIIGPIASIYEWQSQICEESEYIMIVKSVVQCVERLTQRVVQLHSYESPCVLILPVQGGAEKFLEWIDTQTDSRKEEPNGSF